jgi:MinD superfamily P-loop ATPase/predicted Fe-Mo cluster-binding NifX family protein
MKELAVISGKGGTGKTSVVASFAALAGNAVLADCDVDAADLHLVTDPQVEHRETFHCGREAVIRAQDCTSCGLCQSRCRFDAVRRDESGTFTIDPAACEGCGVCVWSCPAKAIDFPERISGQWFVSSTRHGPMVHARLNPGAENSGKLVFRVREEARQLADHAGRGLILIDGPPGVGCPAISSISGASLVLAIAEPTPSGKHDLGRVLDLAARFGLPAAVAINKFDLNVGLSERIESDARKRGAATVGRIAYGHAFTAAQRRGVSVVEVESGCTAEQVRKTWRNVQQLLETASPQHRQERIALRGVLQDVARRQEEAKRPEVEEPLAKSPVATTEEGEHEAMIIALPIADGTLCSHFGHCERFALVEVNETERSIVKVTEEVPPPHEPGVLPRWLRERGADIVIAGGMGERAQQLFARHGVEVVVGAPADTPENLASAYLNGMLEAGRNACDH